MKIHHNPAERKWKQTADFSCGFCLLVSYFRQFVLGCVTLKGVYASWFTTARIYFYVQSIRFIYVGVWGLVWVLFACFNFTVPSTHISMYLLGEEILICFTLQLNSCCNKMVSPPALKHCCFHCGSASSLI